MVNGKIHHFAARGLYNGLFLMGDYETGSYWDHITGECLHGALKGHKLDVFPLLHMSVSQAMVAYPDAHIAISRPSITQRLMATVMERGRKSSVGYMPPYFKRTMGEEDRRRPRMEIGLGVWTTHARRFYAMKSIRARGGALIDELDGQRLLVYIEPTSNIPAALFTEATECNWHDNALHLNTGETICAGALCDAQGATKGIKRPMQMFSRWYGFAYTFPGCEIYAG